MTAIAAVSVGAAIGVTAFIGYRQDRVPTAGDHRPLIRSRHRQVSFNGIVFVFPGGWNVARASCGSPASKTVVLNYQAGPVPSCPFSLPPSNLPTWVMLTAIYGPRYADGWAGHRTTWHGQPAWLATHRKQGGTVVTLTLPWLNAVATAESPNPAQARALLRRLSVRSVPGLAVPRQASSVFIQSLAGRDGDNVARNAVITRADDVRGILADLRSLRPLHSAGTGCDGSWWPQTALLTVHFWHGQARTYVAQFGDCGEVTAGTGSAAATDGALLTYIRRLVPDSGL